MPGIGLSEGETNTVLAVINQIRLGQIDWKKVAEETGAPSKRAARDRLAAITKKARESNSGQRQAQEMAEENGGDADEEKGEEEAIVEEEGKQRRSRETMGKVQGPSPRIRRAKRAEADDDEDLDIERPRARRVKKARANKGKVRSPEEALGRGSSEDNDLEFLFSRRVDAEEDHY